MDPRAADLIKTLALSEHPEGGWYREIFRSAAGVRAADGRQRSACTTIYFLLTATDRSRWHVVQSDEIWHFYEGAPLQLLTVDPAGFALQQRMLGTVTGGQRPSWTVPAGHWQAARSTGAFTLCGCTVAPGFDFADFAMLRDDPALAARFRDDIPGAADFI
ncbi:MAG: cupin domain-containing protein [Phycisphaerales bacterium JB039]